MQDVYSLFKPKKPSPVIFDSPHSGRLYPADFNYACAFDVLRRCEDEFVDQLFEGVCAMDAAYLCALFPRSYIDVNRAADDIDPALLADTWIGDIHPTSRSDAGIGLIRRLANPGEPLYNRPLTQDEIEQRIGAYYSPYHQALQNLIEDGHYMYGQVWHINCHSMPDSTARPQRPIGFSRGLGKAADFVLGDRDGTTCDPAMTRLLRDYIRGLGYHVTINDPFKGVELVERYSDPARGLHSLQIEVNKSLYMDETTGEKTATFDTVKADIDKICAFIIDAAHARLQPLAAD